MNAKGSFEACFFFFSSMSFINLVTEHMFVEFVCVPKFLEWINVTALANQQLVAKMLATVSILAPRPAPVGLLFQVR